MKTSIRRERAGSLLIGTIDSGGRPNTMTPSFMRELLDFAISADADDGVRAVLLSATGPTFSVGADLRELGGAASPTAFVKALSADYHAALAKLFRMEKLLVCAVSGVAAGGGFSLAMAGDLVIAAESASFTVAYTGSGLAPDGACTTVLPQLVGLRRAQELIYLNRRLSAADAQQWGLITRVCADERLPAEAIELARSIAGGAVAALGAAKALLAVSGVETQMERESGRISALAGQAEGREGVAAFLEKRAPRWA